jgi:Zn-dependent peptidase ImmA (M78 family)
MSEKYRRPLIAFYLDEPPPKANRGEDFRRASSTSPPEFDPKLDALIRDIRARHDVIKSLLEDEDATPVPGISSLTLEDCEVIVSELISDYLKFDLLKFRNKRNAREAFGYLRSCVENHGIFVLLMGDLGSHHSKIPASVFRGYCIADPIAPLIVVNDNDADAAWSFTTLHETTHLWLGQTGISGASDDSRVERFCNKVAARILLPISDLGSLATLTTRGFEDILSNVSQYATERNLSRRMVAYQLLQNRTIVTSDYHQLVNRFEEDWLKSKIAERARTPKSSGPNRNVVLRHRLGPALIGLARRSVDSGVLSPTKASRLLGVRPVSVRSFLHPRPRKTGNADALFD